MTAKISEIFHSIQGEGIYQFVPQVFVRFWGCNINCIFCDTNGLSFTEIDESSVLQKIYSFREFWESVALTGGEPLLQAESLQRLCRKLKEDSRIIYLETNGILYRELDMVIEFTDIISLDFKLPSSTNLSDYWDAHYNFLKIASRKEAFVKAVITGSTTRDDIIKSVSIIKEVDLNIPFVLQPAFSCEAFLWAKLDEYKSIALEFIPDVRIIPQLHKHIGVK